MIIIGYKNNKRLGIKLHVLTKQKSTTLDTVNILCSVLSVWGHWPDKEHINCKKYSTVCQCFLCKKGIYYTCQLFLRYKREIFIVGGLGFLKTTRSNPKIPEEVRSLPKTSEVFRRRPKSAEVCQRRARSQCFSLQKSEIARKVLPFINFTHGFRSLHGSELTYFWKLCQAGWQQLTFSNQAWEIGLQAWDRSFQLVDMRLTPKAWELAGIMSYQTSTSCE